MFSLSELENCQVTRQSREKEQQFMIFEQGRRVGAKETKEGKSRENRIERMRKRLRRKGQCQ